VNYDSKTMS